METLNENFKYLINNIPKIVTIKNTMERRRYTKKEHQRSSIHKSREQLIIAFGSVY